MIRCSKCIMPDSYPDIKFDDKGICSKCYEYDKDYGHRDLTGLKKQMEEMLDWAVSQKKNYDCLVPFSGGKDSSYVLYLCRKVYNMKVLAINFINGLQTNEAIENINRIVKKLDVSLLTFGPNWEMMRALYATFLRKTGQFCFPCDMGIWASVHAFAEKEDIPLIISGFSQQIEARGGAIYSYSNRLFRRVTRGQFTERDISYFLEEELQQKVKRRLKRLRLTRYRKQFSMPDYMKWDDKVIKDTISNELGWRAHEDKRTDHIDCIFAPMKNYLMINKWGFGEKTTKYCAMIRDGQMNREEALEKIKKEESLEPPPVYNTFKEMLNITDEDIDNAKYKSHMDYL